MTQPLQNGEDTEVHCVRRLAAVEVAFAALPRHPVCEFIKHALCLLVHFDLGEPRALRCDHLSSESDQFVEVDFDVGMSLDRHLSLSEVLRLHVELS